MRAFSLRGDGEIMFYACVGNHGIMVRSRYQKYEHMMNGDQPKMDALTPMIGQALTVRDQLRVEMGNQMGLGSDGWASQNPNMLEQKTFGSEPLSTNVDRFTPEQQRKMDVLVGEHLPVNPNHLTPEQRSKADVYVGKDAMAEQYVPSKPTPSGALTPEEQSKRSVIVGESAGAGQYIDDMTQTFGGMSEGLEAVNSNPWRPEGAGSRPDDYAGMGYSEPRVEAGTIEPVMNSLTGEYGQSEQFSTVSYNDKGVPREPDHNDYNLDRIMNAPIDTLSVGELDQRALAVKNRIWLDLGKERDEKLAGIPEKLEGTRNQYVEQYNDFTEEEKLHWAQIFGIETADAFADNKLAEDIEYEEKMIKKQFNDDYDAAVTDIDSQYEPYIEVAKEREKREATKIVLNESVVKEESIEHCCGEKITVSTYYLSQDAAKLYLDPEPLLKLSESYGLTTDDVVDAIDFLITVAGVSNPYVAAAAAAYGALSLTKRLDYLPKIENELEKCKPGDYIMIRDAYGIGTGLNYNISHTDGNIVYPYNPDEYEVDLVNVGDMW